MAYTKQTFTDGQILKAEYLNEMSNGILEALEKNLSETLMYTDSAHLADATGTSLKDDNPTRTIMSSFLAVNKGDSIIINNANVKFIIYAFQNTNYDSYLGYIDANPYDNTSALKNWGDNFTFGDTVTLSGKTTAVTYPLYIRLTFRHSDGKSTLFANDFKDSITYNISADNSHLFNLTGNKTRAASPFLTANLISHRGLCDVAPENTLSSAQKAFEAGCKIIEMDIRMTSDNVPVLLHDASINRTSTGTGNIASLTYEEASQYDYGSWFNEDFTGEKLATLEEFLAFCKTRGICAELDIANREFTLQQKRIIYDIVLNLGMIDSTLFTVTDAELADYLSFNPNIIFSLSGITSLSIAQSTLPNYVKYGLVFPSIPIEYLSKDLVSYIHTLGMKAKTWTVNSTAKRDTALSYGVDIILSDNLTSLY